MYKLIAFCKWCQDLPLPKLAAHLKELGFDGVDLPCRPGAPIGPEDAPNMLPEVKKVFDDHGIALERLVTGITEANDVNDRQLEAIRAAGVKRVRLGGYSALPGTCNPRELLDQARRNYVEVQKLLQKHDVRGAVQNHSGSCLEVNVSSTLRMVQDCDPEWVGVQYDPGHQTIAGEPLDLSIDLLGPALHSVNFKSPRFDHFADRETGALRYQAIWLPLRDGMLNVPGALKKLKAVGHTEPISLHAEYRTHYHLIEHDAGATSKLVAEDLQYVRQMMAEHP